MDISAKLKSMGARTVYSYIDRNPDENIPKILDWLEKHDESNSVTNQVRAIREAITDPNNNWSQQIGRAHV